MGRLRRSKHPAIPTASELPELLRVPSAANWALLERLFYAAAPADRESLVRAAEAGLSAWPDELRSLTFTESALPGRESWRVGPSAEDEPWLSLARTIEVEPGDVAHSSPPLPSFNGRSP